MRQPRPQWRVFKNYIHVRTSLALAALFSLCLPRFSPGYQYHTHPIQVHTTMHITNTSRICTHHSTIHRASLRVLPHCDSPRRPDSTRGTWYHTSSIRAAPVGNATVSARRDPGAYTESTPMTSVMAFIWPRSSLSDIPFIVAIVIWEHIE